MHIRLASISFNIILLLSINAFGQTNFIKGKIIDERLDAVSQARIQNSDSVLLGETDINGNFNIEIPLNTKTLLIGSVGLEWTIINLTDSCNQLDIILMLSGTYDYISLNKVDKIISRQFKRLPELHWKAYQKGIFTTEKACYEQSLCRFIKLKEEF